MAVVNTKSVIHNRSDNGRYDNNNETRKQPKSKNDSSTTNQHHEYEFGGPVGTFVTIMALPIVVLLLARWSDSGTIDFNLENLSSVICPNCENSDNSSSIYVILYNCTIGIIAWFAFQVILERILPCDIIEGSYIQNNAKYGKLKYRINGHLAFWVTILCLYNCGIPTYYTVSGSNENRIYQLQRFPIELLYEYYTELAFVTMILSFILTTYLYCNSFRTPPTTITTTNGTSKNGAIVDKRIIFAEGGNTGNHVYDYFIGRELNPRFANTTFDWKVFCELRPGLIGWMLLNLSCLYTQYNTLGYVSYSMYLINLFQGIYVWDALYNEKAILTTMDVTTDGFGFMLVFGDLVWVPFTYSLQARYLVKNDPNLSIPQIACIIVLYMVGYMIFRLSNSQKDAFRTDPTHPSVRHLKYLQTKRGTKLLISGWWGFARKMNYTGDYIIGLSWCLLCGWNSIVPYYYGIYFAILLYHRSMRDDTMCRMKYGSDWDTYKQHVPYRFIPGII